MLMMTIANSKVKATSEMEMAPGAAADSLATEGQTFMRIMSWVALIVVSNIIPSD
jgi:hypothetical protein